MSPYSAAFRAAFEVSTVVLFCLSRALRGPILARFSVSFHKCGGLHLSSLPCMTIHQKERVGQPIKVKCVLISQFLETYLVLIFSRSPPP